MSPLTRSRAILVLLATMLPGRLLPAAETMKPPEDIVDSSISDMTRNVPLRATQRLRVEEMRRDYAAKWAPLCGSIVELSASLPGKDAYRALNSRPSPPSVTKEEKDQLARIQEAEAVRTKAWDTENEAARSRINLRKNLWMKQSELLEALLRQARNAADREAPLRRQMIDAQSHQTAPAESLKKELVEAASIAREKLTAFRDAEKKADDLRLDLAKAERESYDGQRKQDAERRKFRDEEATVWQGVTARKRAASDAYIAEKRRLDGAGIKLEAAKRKAAALRDALRQELAALLSPEQMSARILAVLDSPCTLEFVETPLADAIEQIGVLNTIPMRLDQQAVKEAGIQGEVLISRSYKKQTLQSELHLMFEEYGLAHVVHDGALLITTVEAKPRWVERGAIDPEAVAMPNHAAATQRTAEQLKRPVRLIDGAYIQDAVEYIHFEYDLPIVQIGRAHV